MWFTLKLSVIFLTIYKLLALLLGIIGTCWCLEFVHGNFLLSLECLERRIKFRNSKITGILFFVTLRGFTRAAFFLFLFFVIAARMVYFVMIHHLLHCCGIRPIAAGVSVAAGLRLLLLHHHMWEKGLMIPIRKQMIKKALVRWWRRMSVVHLRHPSSSVSLRLYVGHVGAKFGEWSGPLVHLFFFGAIISKHVGKFVTLIWHCRFHTVTRSHLEFFIITEQSFVWDWDLDQRIVGDRLKPRDVEWRGAFLHLRGGHKVLLLGERLLIRLLRIYLSCWLVQDWSSNFTWSSWNYNIGSLYKGPLFVSWDRLLVFIWIQSLTWVFGCFHGLDNI